MRSSAAPVIATFPDWARRLSVTAIGFGENHVPFVASSGSATMVHGAPAPVLPAVDQSGGLVVSSTASSKAVETGPVGVAERRTRLPSVSPDAQAPAPLPAESSTRTM